MAKKEDLVPVNTIVEKVKGETVKEIIFIEKSTGGDNMVIVFESETVLIMPVYRGCPVQIGKLAEFKTDVDMVVHDLNVRKARVASDIDNTINILRSL